MGRMIKLILSVCLLAISLHMYAGTESVKYDIILFNNKVGSMVVTHETRDDGTDLYTLVTTSKAKILWIDKSNDSKYELVFKAGKLISSVFKEIENGQLKRWTNIKWDGVKYLVDGYKGKRTFSDVPTYTTISAYFEGLKKVGRIFYESEGDFADVEYPEPNTLEFKTSDGHKSVYHYVQNKLTSMEFHVTFATVYMVLSK